MKEALKRRRCATCRESFYDKDLKLIERNKSRARFCRDCIPIDKELTRPELVEQAHRAMWRGFQSGVFTEDETRRAIARMK